MPKLRRKSRLPVSIQEELLRNFVSGVPAHTAAEVFDLNRNTVTLFCHKLRELIYEYIVLDMVSHTGEVEADDSYSGGIRKDRREVVQQEKSLFLAFPNVSERCMQS